MRRVASLYLPNFAVDRLRRIDRAKRGTPPERRSQLSRPGTSVLERSEQDVVPPEPGTRIEDCSCPRGGGWRPGARWAKGEDEWLDRRIARKTAQKAALEAKFENLPLHQRPPMRELGRRSEPAGPLFQKKRRALAPVLPRPQPVEDPMAITSRDGQRIVIAAACPAAQALGLHPGMSLTQARAMVPGLDIRDAEPEADAALLNRLAFFAARRWTPIVAVSDPTGLFLDLSGVSHLFGGEQRLCARILRFCARFGLSARIAVAGAPGAAYALARHSGTPITLCLPGGETEALAPLPIVALRLDQEILAIANRLGIERIGDLAALPRSPLGRRFGGTLLARLDQAFGAKAEPFDPVVPSDPPSASVRFAEPIATAEAIGTALARLMADLVTTLEKAGLAARALVLLCARIDGAEQRVTIGTARGTRDAVHLLRLMRAKIETIEPGFGIEGMRLIAPWHERLGPVPVDSELGGERPAPDLAPLIDRLATRLGPDSLFRVSAVESDVPERSICRIGALEPAAGWPDWPRPVRLFSPPERVEKVMAELPDQAPIRFSWRGRMHRVHRADGPERIHGEWWRRSGEADAVRDYFQVEDEEGARFWLYRRGDGLDPRTGDLSWHLQGMFG